MVQTFGLKQHPHKCLLNSLKLLNTYSNTDAFVHSHFKCAFALNPVKILSLLGSQRYKITEFLTFFLLAKWESTLT